MTIFDKYGVLKSVGVFILYALYFFLIRKSLFFLLDKGYLDEFPDLFFDNIDLIAYLPLIILILILSKKYKVKVDGNRGFFTIILIAVLFRVAEDPLIQFNSIKEGVKILEVSSSLKTAGMSSFLLLVLAIPFVEEYFFRKVMINLMNKTLYGVILSSILFTLVHIFTKTDILYLVGIFLLGVIAGWVYIKYGFLHCFLLHSTYNLIYFALAYSFTGFYYHTLTFLAFDIWYWLIVGLSLSILIYLIGNKTTAP